MHARNEALLSRESVRLGLTVAILAGVAIVAAWIAFGRSLPYSSDAGIFHRIATDPFGDGGALAGLRDDTGTGYRYGRILYPLTAWVLAAGRPAAAQWTLPVVYALSVGAMVTFAGELCGRAGVAIRKGLWVLAAPALFLTVPVLFSEPFAVSLLLLAYLLALRGREGPAIAAIALALLAKESLLVGALPLAWLAYRRDGARARRWLLALLPIATWWVWVRLRVGVLPALDPAYGRRGALSWMLGGPVTVLREGPRDEGLFGLAIVVLVLTVTASVAAWRFHPSPVAAGSVALAALVLFLGPGAWRIPGEAIRLMLPAQTLAIVALVSRARAVAPSRTLS